MVCNNVGDLEGTGCYLTSNSFKSLEITVTFPRDTDSIQVQDLEVCETHNFFHDFGEAYQRDNVCRVCYLLIIANDNIIIVHQIRITGICKYREA